ncbi:MAG: family N-acetyltransferase [Clostridia bacterium]|jgi:GNAT superfamily N-acetyltransferase|nr:family N-acetyltransferase [Clostridia bacterium]
MEIVYTDGTDRDFVELCKMLDDNLNEIVGGEKQREQYIQYNTLADIHDVILIYHDKVPVACASFKFYDEDTAEIKRVFVRREYRGKGISKQLMSILEKRAKDKGFSKLILETGSPLIEAIALYRKMNYEVTENYGQYKDMQESICMQKSI